MQPDPFTASVADRVTDLNERYLNHAAQAVLKRALTDDTVGRIAMVSSFGAESVVLLHMLSVINPATPILFIDTQMLFEETLTYQQEVAAHLGLTDVRTIRATREAVAAHDPDGLLHKSSTDACCDLRKTVPLENALSNFDAWITGRKRFQGKTRATLDFFENEGDTRIKINPLAHWTPDDVQDYIINNRLPRHPLVAKGYPSIGCAPCTSRVAPGEDPRSGRWRDQDKEECGIHFINGKVVRGPILKEEPMNIIVTDQGFGQDDWTLAYTTPDELADNSDAPALAIDLASDADPAVLAGKLDGIDMIRIDFPSFADGRGFTLARRLRLMGFNGRLRAKGHVIADQYAMARRSGFEEVEITPELAERQPWDQWKARATWQDHDYQNRLRGAV
ncbi:Phosphoadenosine phosphosulfate reductase [Actibacterium lipolyticum]|uniref:Adenosine 5'-phosphosulfate reductase n=2 Tax=Actibacterium lipolyticum TaxID=1524263 RepID=A0A238JYC3_9RHOB|nr:Phosphoadenosine phosphosulfate reductase [Actibacterium lipolyticum]